MLGQSDRNGASEQTGDVIQGALSAIRLHLGMDVGYFSEFVGDRTIFRRVDAPGLEHLIKPGDSQRLDDVYCNHILEGRLPELIPDTAAEPLALSLPITSVVPIGAHASIPILHPDGRPYGMLCCLSQKPNHALNTRDLDTMRVFAGLVTRQLHSELGAEQARRDRRSTIEETIAAGAFAMAYQPIFRLETMEIVSYEALTRFSGEPYRAPDEWFAAAAECGLGVELELAAIRAAVKGFAHLPPDVTLSVNVSPQAVADGRLLSCLDPDNLSRTVLEITEHAPVPCYASLRATLAPLVAAGLKIAVDDAGAGYSGLQHIVQVAPEIIKMDISLTRGIDADRARRALASAMVYYARETGALIVAEGVETPEELETLKLLGISRGQGYYLARPAPLGLLAPAELHA